MVLGVPHILSKGVLAHVYKQLDASPADDRSPLAMPWSWSYDSTGSSTVCDDCDEHHKVKVPWSMRPLNRLGSLLVFVFGIFLTYHFATRASGAPAVSPRAHFYEKYANYPKSFDMRHPLLIDDANVTLSEFLDWHWPTAGAPPVRVWLTLSDSWWINRGTANLQYFINEMNLVNEQESVLIVLCMDKICHKEARKNRMFAYSAYPDTRPEQILPATWPKLASLIDVLRFRDVFFVDSDVSFRTSPYPYMNKYIPDNDLVIQENVVFDHANTGWFWMRAGPVSSDSWQKVLDMDMVNESRDQYNFNEVLHSTELRKVENGPPKMDFVSENGLRVHILDRNTFRSHHFELDEVYATQRTDSVYLHMTCGDDFLTKEYMSMAQGFWSDVGRHFVNSKKLLSVSALGGTEADVNRMMAILLAVSHFTRRAFEPPEYVTFTNIDAQKRAYSAYPLGHIARDFGIDVLEPGFTRYAVNTLAHQTSLDYPHFPNPKNSSFINKKMWPIVLRDERDRSQRIAQLTDITEVDVRPFQSLHELVNFVDTLDAKHVKLIHFEWMNGATWRQWDDIPSRLSKFILPCTNIDQAPVCDNMCMFRNIEHIVYFDENEGRNDWW